MTDISEKRRLFVWDAPTRIFHWLIVAAVIVGWATGEADTAFWFEVHLISGYTLMAALVFRVIWGFAGSRHALFSDFLRGWGAVGDYTAKLARFKPPHFTGHNPLGGWMVILLLLALTGMVVTGLFGGEAHEDEVGPLAYMVAPALAEELVEVHEIIFNVLLVLVAIHIAGVIADTVLTRDNLVHAMITGYKRVPAGSTEADAAPVSAARTAVVLIVAIAVTWVVVSL